MSAIESYAETRKKIQDLREQAKAAAKQAFSDGAAELFKKHPKLEAFSWKQYTPYFNDGDECVFSVHNDEINVTFAGEEHDYVSQREDNKTELGAAINDAIEFLRVFDEEDYRGMFDDHVEVTVTAKGAEATSYSHD